MVRRAAGDDGLTLIELLIAIAVSTIVIGAIGVPLILGLQTTSKSTTKLRESNDAELLATRLAADVQSVSSSGIDQSPGAGTGCAADSVSPGSINRLRLQWSETINSSTTNYSVSYRTLQSGADWKLVRVFCKGGNLSTATADISYAASNLKNPSVTPPVVSLSQREVTLQLTDASGYTYVIHGYRRTP